MHEKEQWINVIKDNSHETIASIILADIERIEKQEQEIKRLKRRLEEYQEYVEINHKEIERLNNIINELENIIDIEMNKMGYAKYDSCLMLMKMKIKELKGSDEE